MSFRADDEVPEAIRWRTWSERAAVELFGTLEVVLKDGGRDGIRTHDLLIANSGENKLRQGATIT